MLIKNKLKMEHIFLHKKHKLSVKSIAESPPMYHFYIAAAASVTDIQKADG